MRKHLLLFLFTIAVSWPVYGQSPAAVRAYRKGVNLRMQGELDQALKHFQKATRKSSDYTAAWIQMGQLLSELGNCDRSLNAYAKASIHSPRQGLFSMGQQALECGLYMRADSALSAYISIPEAPSKHIQEAKRWKANCAFALQELKRDDLKEIIDLGDEVNQLDASYFPAISGNGQMMIYTARNLLEGQTHEDIWLAIKQPSGEWESLRLPGFVNSGGNEGAVASSGDMSVIVFTACDRTGGEGSCDLYLARRLRDGSYHHPVRMNSQINTPQWESQPSVSADGQWLYFIRANKNQGDRAGNIYRAHWDGRDYVDVEPLNNTVNTPFREATPCIHPNGRTLFFASEGHVGMGGLDLYRSDRLDDNTWSEPVNLGAGINSYADDFGISVHPNGEIAYLSRGDLGDVSGLYTSGEIRLYQVELDESIEHIHWLEVYAYAITRHKTLPIKVNWSRYSVNSNRSEPLRHRGVKFETPLYSGEVLGLNTFEKGYMMASKQFTMAESDTFLLVRDTIYLMQAISGLEFNAQNILFDFDRATLRPNSKHEINVIHQFLSTNPTRSIVIEGHTDNEGSDSYNMQLSLKRAKAVRDALVATGIDKSRLQVSGLGSSQPVASNETEEGRQQNRRTVIRIL